MLEEDLRDTCRRAAAAVLHIRSLPRGVLRSARRRRLPAPDDPTQALGRQRPDALDAKVWPALDLDERRVDEFVDARRRRGRSCRGFRSTVLQLLEQLRAAGVVPWLTRPVTTRQRAPCWRATRSICGGSARSRSARSRGTCRSCARWSPSASTGMPPAPTLCAPAMSATSSSPEFVAWRPRRRSTWAPPCARSCGSCSCAARPRRISPSPSRRCASGELSSVPRHLSARDVERLLRSLRPFVGHGAPGPRDPPAPRPTRSSRQRGHRARARRPALARGRDRRPRQGPRPRPPAPAPRRGRGARPLPAEGPPAGQFSTRLPLQTGATPRLRLIPPPSRRSWRARSSGPGSRRRRAARTCFATAWPPR